MTAQEVETHGVHTFSAKDRPSISSVSCTRYVSVLLKLSHEHKPKAELRCAIARDNAAEFKVINGAPAEAERVLQTVNIAPRANFRFEFPQLPRPHTL
jgi:fatty acid synthase subunit alpha